MIIIILINNDNMIIINNIMIMIDIYKVLNKNSTITKKQSK